MKPDFRNECIHKYRPASLALAAACGSSWGQKDTIPLQYTSFLLPNPIEASLWGSSAKSQKGQDRGQAMGMAVVHRFIPPSHLWAYPVQAQHGLTLKAIWNCQQVQNTASYFLNKVPR